MNSIEFQLQAPATQSIELVLHDLTQCPGFLGIEEFSLIESEVDALLGERSYSGGDLPQSVLDEVNDEMIGKTKIKVYFEGEYASSAQSIIESAGLIWSSYEIQNEDWNQTWRTHYKPILIDDELMVVPSWEDVNTTGVALRIYPGMGFGTGGHETTHMCLSLIKKYIKNLTTTALDYGSGSGILGIGSLLLNPESRICGVEIDQAAHDNARVNFELNGISGSRFELVMEKDPINDMYPAIFANILEPILVLKKDLFTKHCSIGGILIVSGILQHQVQTILSTYLLNQEWQTKEVLTKGDWASIVFERI
jgi:ribosomal protein L11 methyltransferase